MTVSRDTADYVKAQVAVLNPWTDRLPEPHEL